MKEGEGWIKTWFPELLQHVHIISLLLALLSSLLVGQDSLNNPKNFCCNFEKFRLFHHLTSGDSEVL